MFGIIGDVIDIALSPLNDAIEILEGLTEGELRERAILRFGASAIVGLDTTEIIELLAESMIDD
ncbi:hypothetical protein LCGC14_0921370 [marine sediment metagenome]|uniref:Uncharacterized protein n=1 Tax=marine sediment metagenome TaxID=412755 RepID=A0A0F9RXE4_9ZZZZ